MSKLFYLVAVLKGLVIGGTMLVPGVSGGSMAMILGIYDRLVSAISSFMKHKRQNLLLLGAVALGGGCGAVLFAGPVLGLIERYPMPVLFFFLGAVAGGVPLILRQAQIKRISLKAVLFVAAGVLAVRLLAAIPAGTFETKMDAGFTSVILLAAAGFIAAVALVLPGVSVSYLLLVMGLYDETMLAVRDFHLPFLLPLGLGLVLGIFLTTKLLEGAMRRFPQATYLMILGFVLGSVVELFPGIPTGRELPLALGTLLLGFSLITLITSEKCRERMLRFFSKGRRQSGQGAKGESEDIKEQ